MLVWLVHKSGSTEAGLGERREGGGLGWRWMVGWREGGGSAFARAGKFLRLAVPPLPGNLTAPTKAQQQRQYTGSRKTWGCPMSCPSMGGLPIMSLENLFCKGNWVLLCCFGQYLLMWVLTCKLPLKCQGKSTIRTIP